MNISYILSSSLSSDLYKNPFITNLYSNLVQSMENISIFYHYIDDVYSMLSYSPELCSTQYDMLNIVLISFTLALTSVSLLIFPIFTTF